MVTIAHYSHHTDLGLALVSAVAVGTNNGDITQHDKYRKTEKGRLGLAYHLMRP